MRAKVTYLHHSGFTVELAHDFFVFDWDGTDPAPCVPADKRLTVFISHRHGDHFSPLAVSLAQKTPGALLLCGRGVPCREAGGVVVRPAAPFETNGLTVQALRSTDEGAAFLVHTPNACVYHAGDLNWWHWEGEPDPWNPNMERKYRAEMEKLRGESIDLAFVPVDPRLETAYALGVDLFMRTADVKYVFPMHCWEDASIGDRLRADPVSEPYRDRIVFLSRPGEAWKMDDGMPDERMEG